jgi:hypothetical protein
MERFEEGKAKHNDPQKTIAYYNELIDIMEDVGTVGKKIISEVTRLYH